MIQTFSLSPGVTLRCFQDRRFKQGCLSVQLVRPMDGAEAAMNALLPTILLRGTVQHPSLRSITMQLDDLYGAAIGPMVRRVGDYQTTGFYCSFMDERFALPGDRVLEPLVQFIRELLMESPLENGGFLERYVEQEKKNLISAIECDRNDKQAYAAQQLLKLLCAADSYGIPRTGEPEQVAAITAQGLRAHYEKILRHAPLALCYVGSWEPERVARLLTRLVFPDREPIPLPPQSDLHAAPGRQVTETMNVTQSALCMGFTTPITERNGDFYAMQLLNLVYGASDTSKLFVNVREKQSLCYSISSGYHGSKGLVVVSAGIDGGSRQRVQEEILGQLERCAAGDIREKELRDAKQSMRAALQGVHDSPGAIESYYSRGALRGSLLEPEAYMERVNAVALSQLAEAAKTVQMHSSYFLTEEGSGQ